MSQVQVNGMLMTGQGTVVEKPEPFYPKDDKTGVQGTRGFFKIKLGFLGGYVALSCSEEQFKSLQVGQEIRIRAAVSTEAGKTKFTLAEVAPAKA